MMNQIKRISAPGEVQLYAPYILATFAGALIYFLFQMQASGGLLAVLGVPVTPRFAAGAASWAYQLPALLVMGIAAIFLGRYLEARPWKIGAVAFASCCGGVVVAAGLLQAMTGFAVDLRLALILAVGVLICAQMRRSADKDHAVFVRDMAADHRQVLLEGICENTYDGIIVADHECKIIYANQAALRLYGYEDTTLIGRALDRLTPTINQGRVGREIEFYLEKAKAEGAQIGPLETTGLKQGGGIVSIDLVVSVADLAIDPDHPQERRTQGRPVYICNMRDVSSRKKMEEARHNALEQQVIANRSKSEFVANMSHELRTPLNAIIGFSEMLSGAYFGDLNPKQDEYVGDVHSSATHLLRLINDILDISKIESGHMDLQEEEVDIEDAVASCINLVQHRAKEIGVTLDTCWESPARRLHADERKLKQVLLNLLSNAVKFTPAGGDVQIRTRIEPDGGFALAVIDSGVGIAEADIAQCLEPFGQVDSGLDRKYEGTGLGLPLTKSLVEAHGGTLTLESSLGAGTMATVRLPADRLRGADKPAVAAPKQKRRQRSRQIQRAQAI